MIASGLHAHTAPCVWCVDHHPGGIRTASSVEAHLINIRHTQELVKVDRSVKGIAAVLMPWYNLLRQGVGYPQFRDTRCDIYRDVSALWTGTCYKWPRLRS